MKVTTLTVDCGGTGIKASVLDKGGKVLIDFPYFKTPYPLSPSKLISIINDFVKADNRIKRVTVGLPGMIRGGKVIVIPHYVNASGPRGVVDPHLKKAWYGFDMQSMLKKKLKLPTLVLNDAEVHAAGVITGTGLEIVMTLGTGLGFAVFHGGKLSPHFELSHATVRRNTTYDTWIGERERKRMGNTFWSRRVRLMVSELRPVFLWDRLYIGGGNSHNIVQRDLLLMGDDVVIVPNSAGVSGGVRAWQL